jgi:hypothetical protein
MSLTTEQSIILADDIIASTYPPVVAARDAGDNAELAVLYNTDSTFWVWRTALEVSEYREGLDWPEVELLTTGEARIWDWTTGNMTLPLEVGKVGVRTGLAQVWNPATETRNNLIGMASRLTTIAEKLYVTGDGTSNDPGDLGWEGLLTTSNVTNALNDDRFISNEVPLTNQVNRSQRLIVTVSADLPNPVSIQYQIQNGTAAWRGSSIQGLTNVQAAGDYYASLPGSLILDADAKIRVVNPLNVAVSLVVERL